jgi:hypothetical protein
MDVPRRQSVKVLQNGVQNRFHGVCQTANLADDELSLKHQARLLLSSGIERDAEGGQAW